jgi:hypothetical protein
MLLLLLLHWMGVIEALVHGLGQLEQGNNESNRNCILDVTLFIESIDLSEDTSKATGVTLQNGKKFKARDGVIFNAPVWSLKGLLKDEKAKEKVNDHLYIVGIYE